MRLMSVGPRPEARPAAFDFLSGGGEMGALIRAFDWSSTPLGPPARWPQSLRTVLDIMLRSQSAIFLWWGEELIQFYNDAYRPIPGSAKHPAALGNRGRETWAEIWGVSEKVLGERRLRTLRALGAVSPEVRSTEEACAAAVRVLAENTHDVPFALVYLLEPEGHAYLAGSAGIDATHPAAMLPLVRGSDSGKLMPEAMPRAERRFARSVVTRDQHLRSRKRQRERVPPGHRRFPQDSPRF